MLAVQSRFTYVSRTAVAALVAVAAITGVRSANAQYGQPQGEQVQMQGSYAGYGPTQGMNMNPTQGNPFIGSWFGASPLQNGSGRIVSFTEYLPNGNSRVSSIFQGGAMNGIRMQIWGKYAVKQIGPNRYNLTIYVKGYAPREICTTGGSCQPNTLPMSATETDDMQGPGKYHSHSELNGVVTDVDATRNPVPQELLSSVGPRLTFTPPPQAAGGGGGGGAAPTMPTLHPYVTPGGGNYHVPGQGGTCDDAQQNRICTINNGHMYTNSQGCRICAGPN